MCWGSWHFYFLWHLCFLQSPPFHIFWNRMCSVIWNVLSDNVINRAGTCPRKPWDLSLIFIKELLLWVLLGCHLSIFINCISQLHWIEKSCCFMSFLISPTQMLWTLNGPKKKFIKVTVVCLIQLNSKNRLKRWCFQGKQSILVINVFAICWNWSSIWRWNLTKRMKSWTRVRTFRLLLLKYACWLPGSFS